MGKASGMQRTMRLAGATGVGVGAIVGGGILALAGVAFATTGPSALLVLVYRNEESPVTFRTRA